MEKEYKGISWNRQKQQWHASIREKGILYECGFYTEIIDAVKARDKCIITHVLDFKKLQIIKKKKK